MRRQRRRSKQQRSTKPNAHARADGDARAWHWKAAVALWSCWQALRLFPCHWPSIVHCLPGQRRNQCTGCCTGCCIGCSLNAAGAPPLACQSAKEKAKSGQHVSTKNQRPAAEHQAASSSSITVISIRPPLTRAAKLDGGGN